MFVELNGKQQFQQLWLTSDNSGTHSCPPERLHFQPPASHKTGFLLPFLKMQIHTIKYWVTWVCESALYGRKELVYIMPNSLIKVLFDLYILPTKSLFSHQLSNHCQFLWIALSSHIKIHSRIRSSSSLTPICMSLKSTSQAVEHMTSPTLCRKQKFTPPTGSILRNPLMCLPKKNGSLPECGGGSFLCSENEMVLSVSPKPSHLLLYRLSFPNKAVTWLLSIHCHHKSQDSTKQHFTVCIRKTV